MEAYRKVPAFSTLQSLFMDLSELKEAIAHGEDSRTQFKADVRNVDSLAAEMVAFANSYGGTIFIGVEDDGSLPGLSREDVGRINQLISNAASQHVKSPLTVETENIGVGKGKAVIRLSVPDGIDKPYFDNKGIIWLKSGSDKRRVGSKEELRRLFQRVDLFHADRIPTTAGIEKLDKLRFRDFLKESFKTDLPDSSDELLQLLRNMNLATDEGALNLAGLLLFAEHPEWIKPAFVVKAVAFPGESIHATDYLDSEDFAGPLRRVFDDALAFVARNLRKVRAGRGVNSQGKPEIPLVVFEELIVNALIHRDYFISAPIRIFVFSDRIEIISPGHLPDNLTIEMIKRGNSNLRNPILASFAAKNVLPYRGLGSGIRRAMEEWPHIEFIDDHDGSLFTAVVDRDPTGQYRSKGGTAMEVTTEVTMEVTTEVARLLQVFTGAHSRSELQNKMRLKNSEHFRKGYLLPSLDAGLIEMTIPDKPRSSKQRYRLTQKGREVSGRDLS